MTERLLTILLTIPEAAQETRMSRGFIEKEIREGRLIARKTGRHTRIRRDELELWAQRLPVKIAVKAIADDSSPTKAAPGYPVEKRVSVQS